MIEIKNLHAKVEDNQILNGINLVERSVAHSLAIVECTRHRR